MRITLKGVIESLVRFVLFEGTVWFFLLVGAVDNVGLHVCANLTSIVFGGVLGYLSRRHDRPLEYGVVVAACMVATWLAGLDYLLACFPMIVAAMCVNQVLRGDSAWESAPRGGGPGIFNGW